MRTKTHFLFDILFQVKRNIYRFASTTSYHALAFECLVRFFYFMLKFLLIFKKRYIYNRKVSVIHLSILFLNKY